jgi:hypothetical protein
LQRQVIVNCTSIIRPQLPLDAGASLASAPESRDDADKTRPITAAEPACGHVSSSDSGPGRLSALVLVSLGPALFWTGGLALAGKLLGFAVTTTMLAGILVPVFGFLLLACSPCFLRPEQAAEALA